MFGSDIGVLRVFVQDTKTGTYAILSRSGITAIQSLYILVFVTQALACKGWFSYSVACIHKIMVI